MALKHKRHVQVTLDQKGQATTEYILLISVVVGFFYTIIQGLGAIGVGKKLTDPLKSTYAAVYKYGHPKAKGFDEGAPQYHPEIQGGNNFRIFASPETK